MLRSLARRQSLRVKVAIVGGTLISVEQAPWQVLVFARLSQQRGLLCGGSILSSGTVLTAAHCMFDPVSGKQVPAGEVFVFAGISDYETERGTEDRVSKVRVHPYYFENSGDVDPDDVAVLQLKNSLTVGAKVQPIALAPQSEPSERTSVRLTGFGLQNPEQEPTGQLFAIRMALADSRGCGGDADAVIVCASSPAGSACSGDSGGGLTLENGSLLGVVDTVRINAGRTCAAGALASFASVTAPEIRSFIEGNDTPPRAPRGGGAVIQGTATVGQSFRCLAGNWSGSPGFTFAFIDASGGQILQSGPSSTYTLLQSDVGRTIFCEVRAVNAGGTGISRTNPSSPVLAAPRSEVLASVSPSSTAMPGPNAAAQARLLSTVIGVQPNGTALVKVACTGSSRCRGTLTLTIRAHMRRGRRGVSRILRLGSAGFAIAAGRMATVRIMLSSAARARLTAAHRRLAARLTIVVLQPAPAHASSTTIHLILRGQATGGTNR